MDIYDARKLLDRGIAKVAEGKDPDPLPIVALIFIDRELEKRTPKKPRHYRQENLGHDWHLESGGAVDKWAWEDQDSLHHGPVCRRCGFSFCVDCRPTGWEDKLCVVDYHECPNPECGHKVNPYDNFCRDCGQALSLENAEEEK